MAHSSRNVLLFRTLAALLLVSVTGCASSSRSGWHAYEKGDYAAALARWTPLAEHGDADAQYLVGLMHDDGQGVPADARAAAHWYALAAEQDHAPAQNNLGVLFLSGRGVLRSELQAARWFASAAELGFGPARSNLAMVQMAQQTAAQLALRMPAPHLAPVPTRVADPGSVALAPTRPGTR